MADEHEPEGPPRNLQDMTSEAMRIFVEDGNVTDLNTANGVNDRLRPTCGLETQEPSDRATSTIRRAARDVSDLGEPMLAHVDLATQVEQMTARMDEAKTRMVADQKLLDDLGATKPDLIQRGLETINKFVKHNPAVLPKLLRELKPIEAELPLNGFKVREGVSQVTGQLAGNKRRRDEYEDTRERDIAFTTTTRSDGTSEFCSSVLATVLNNGNDIRTQNVNIVSLQVDWDIALEWSRTEEVARHDYCAVIHGLTLTANSSNDALNLAQMLLIRAHTTPSSLSVASLENLVALLNTADDSTVRRSMGFIYTLLRRKNNGPGLPWSVSRTLLIVRCLSVMASYCRGTDVCSELAHLAKRILRCGPCTLSVLTRAMLEHAIKLLERSPERLADTIARLASDTRVRTKSGQTLYVDGEDLLVVNTDNEVAFVRGNEFSVPSGGFRAKPCLDFEAAPLIGTCRVELLSVGEGKSLDELFTMALSRALDEKLPRYHPDYIFIVDQRR